jgi:t-SNARE complex subunit (syntaxin)
MGHGSKDKKSGISFFSRKKKKKDLSMQANSSSAPALAIEQIASSSSLISSDIDSLSQLHKQTISLMRQMAANTQAINDEAGRVRLLVGIEKAAEVATAVSKLSDANYECVQQIEQLLLQINHFDEHRTAANVELATLKANLSKTIKVDYVDVLRAFLSSHVYYDEQGKKRAHDLYAVLNPNAKEQSLAHDIEEILAMQVAGFNNAQAKAALNAIKARHQQIIQIERGLTDIQILMHTLAIFVDTQAALIEEITVNVHHAKASVQDGEADIKKAMQAKM